LYRRVRRDRCAHPATRTTLDGMTYTATLPATTSTWARRAAVVGAAVVAAEAVFFVLHTGAGIDLAVRNGTTVDHVGPGAVGITAVVAALAGWGLLALLERLTELGRLIWTAIAVAVFVVSLLGTAGGLTTSAKLGLAVLHLTVAAVVIAGLPAAGRKAGR
jgi:hypothetical protein